MRDIRTLAFVHKPDAVVFLGDLFESKRLLRADIVSATYQQIQKPYLSRNATGTIPFHLLAGNHDYFMDSCTLDALHNPENNRYVYRKGLPLEQLLVEQSGERLLFLPNGHALSDTEIEQVMGMRLDAVFLHIDIPNALPHINPNLYELPEWLLKADIRNIVSGHYHTPGIVAIADNRPVHICGAPLCHSWRDIDDTLSRGAMLLDTGTGAIRRYPVGDKYPKFYPCNKDGARPSVDFIRSTPDKSAAVSAIQHKSVNTIAGGTTNQILAAYLKNKLPALSPQEFSEYFKAGITFMKGGDSSNGKA
jgi:hypothetical protein